MVPLIDTSQALPEPLRPLYRLIQGPVEHFAGLSQINAIHAQLRGLAPKAFGDKALTLLGASVSYDLQALARARAAQGPLVVVANHPYGGIEAMAFISLLHDLNPGFKLFANSMLARIPEFDPFLISVNPFGGSGAASENIKPLRLAMKHLHQGGVLGVFPAGEVSVWRWRESRVADLPWSPQIARLIQASHASVLPIYFTGCNSAFFLAAGALARPLKTPLLPSELVRRRPGMFEMRIGELIRPETLKFTRDPIDLAAYLRERTYKLGV